MKSWITTPMYSWGVDLSDGRISHEACSLAGTLGLGKLICFYDDNGISIDGEVEGWFTDNTPAALETMAGGSFAGVDGHDSRYDRQKPLKPRARTEVAQPDLLQNGYRFWIT